MLVKSLSRERLRKQFLPLPRMRVPLRDDRSVDLTDRFMHLHKRTHATPAAHLKQVRVEESPCTRLVKRDCI
ncbi:hypothetical protein D3C78_1678030 [compost metagenome]